MVKRALAWLGLFAACASFGGCGKTGGDDAGPITESELPQTYANLLCDSLGSCCNAASLTFDSAQCRTVQAARFTDLLNSYDPNLVVYDAQAAGDCLAGISTKLSCGNPDGSGDVPVCQKVFNGKLKPGAVCKSSQECERPSGGGFAYCGSGGLEQTTMLCMQEPSAASVHGKAGSACNGSCSGNDTCFGSDAGSQSGTAPAPAPANVYCYQRDGLFCGMQQTCEPLLGLGQQCFDQGSCSADLFCDFNTSMCATLLAAGEPCNSRSDCKSGNCTQAAVCANAPVTQDNCTSGLLDN